MRPDDVRRIPKIVDHTLAPNGAMAVFVLKTVRGDQVAHEIWRVDTDGASRPCPLTQGGNDVAPSFSPDGAKVAFIRTLARTCQLCVYDLVDQSLDVRAETGAGMGMAASIRHIRGTSPPQWSPDGALLAYIAPVRSVPLFDGSSATVIRTLPYQFDGRGNIADNRLHIFCVAASGDSAPRQVSTADADHWDVVWRPDGKAICFGSDFEVDGFHSQALFEAAVDANSNVRRYRRLTDGRCTVNLPAYSVSSSTIGFIGIEWPVPDQPDIRARNVSLWQVDAARDVPVQRRVSGVEEFDIDDSRIRPLLVDDDGRPMLSMLSRGAVHLGMMRDGVWAPLIEGNVHVASYARANDVTTAVVMSPKSSGELFVVRDGATARLTDFGEQYRDVPLHDYIELHGQAADGYPVHGWLMLPPTTGPHPLLLLIHGGPDTQWGYALNEEAQAYVTAGFAVLLPNPRGSAGYGEAHARALNGRVTKVDVDDVLALLEVATARDDIDATNVCLTGRSYGGFLTGWLAAHHGQHFRAALGECGIYDWNSALSTSDIGWQLSAMVGNDPADWHSCSPLAYAAQITVPFLVMNYRSDRRIPLEQGQRMFAALHRSGNPSEFVLFDGGPHTFAESGPPADRVARLRIIIEWFRKWLSSVA